MKGDRFTRVIMSSSCTRVANFFRFPSVRWRARAMAVAARKEQLESAATSQAPSDRSRHNPRWGWATSVFRQLALEFPSAETQRPPACREDPQPIPNVCRHVTPDAFCFPASRGRSLAVTSRCRAEPDSGDLRLDRPAIGHFRGSIASKSLRSISRTAPVFEPAPARTPRRRDREVGDDVRNASCASWKVARPRAEHKRVSLLVGVDESANIARIARAIAREENVGAQFRMAAVTRSIAAWQPCP